jgi:hypothetical protein
LRTRTSRLVLCTVFLVLMLPGLGCTVRAPVSETFALTTTPSRTQESASSGVALSVQVNNAMFSTLGIPYVFSWSVGDPSGSSQSTTSSVLSTTPSWSFSVTYPSSFSGANLNLPGVYAINVSETTPASNPGAVIGSFTVGMTDSPTYQRTYPVRIQGGGYLPSDTVNITIVRSGDSVEVFSSSRPANTNGLVIDTWQTLAGTTTGSYTITLVGKNTPPKSVSDTQQFTVYPTNITAVGFSTSSLALERSETQGFRFNATYLVGLPFSQGSPLIRLTEPGGTTAHLVSTSYNISQGSFEGIFVLPLAGGTGIWNATIQPLSLNDAYGNGGPLLPITASFNVLPAVLSVTLSSSNTVFGVGDTFPIQATILTPGGAVFSQGTVQATMTLSGKSVGLPVSLTYDPTRGQWIGSYKVASTDTSGAWLVTVSASDSYGNIGRSSVTETISGSGLQSTPTSMLWSYLAIVLLVIAFGFIILITRRMKSTRREVKLDLQAIKSQADKVKDDDFLKSIHTQLQRKKQEVGLGDPHHD